MIERGSAVTELTAPYVALTVLHWKTQSALLFLEEIAEILSVVANRTYVSD